MAKLGFCQQKAKLFFRATLTFEGGHIGIQHDPMHGRQERWCTASCKVGKRDYAQPTLGPLKGNEGRTRSLHVVGGPTGMSHRRGYPPAHPSPHGPREAGAAQLVK